MKTTILSHTGSARFRAQRDSARSERDVALNERDLARSDLRLLEESDLLRNEFVANITHDLRNPVSAIQMAIDILRSEIGDAKRELLMGIIERNAIHAEELISHLLDVNLINCGGKLPLETEDCDIHAIIQRCVNSVIPKIRKSIVVGPRVLQGLWGVWDPLALERIFNNLIGNAIKFRAKNTKIHITFSRDSHTTNVNVQNFGKVISLSDQLNIFNSHYKCTRVGTNSQQGWGLGLTLVKGIAESHGGKVDVTSTEDEGTIFTIRLPNVIE